MNGHPFYLVRMHIHGKNHEVFPQLFLFSSICIFAQLAALFLASPAHAALSVDGHTSASDQDIRDEGYGYNLFVTGPEVYSGDTDPALVIFVHYRSHTEEVSSIDVDGVAAVRQGTVVRENEYSTEAWIATGLNEAQWGAALDVQWTWEVDDAIVEVYKVTEVSQSQPVAETITNHAGTDVEQPNLAFSYTEYNQMYLGGITSYTGDFNSITADNLDGSYTATTINGYAATGYVAGSAYSSTTMNWTQSANWHWSGIGVALRQTGNEVSLATTPSISFTTAPSEGGTIGEIVRFVGSVTSTDPLTEFSYYLDSTVVLTTDEYTAVSSTQWDFDFEVVTTPGSKTIYFYGENNVDGSYGEMDNINFTVVASDRPTCTLENLGAQISDTTPTYTATCTSDDGVAQASYRIYHELDGTIVNWTDIPTTTSGSFGDTSVSFSFTSPVELNEGAHLVYIDVKNNYQQWISSNGAEANLPVDRIVIEADDNRAPRLHVNAIEPNPTSDQQPYVTGICADDYTTEVNSDINTVEYNLNSGGWTNIYSYSAGTASTSRIFEVQLPTLTAGQTHTVQVRCSDRASNTTSVSSQSVEVLAQQVEAAGEVSVTENFITQDRKIPFYTDAIWGNGYLRLKEQFSPTFSAIDTSGYMNRYGSTLGVSTYVIKEGTDNLVWYVKQNEVVSYNTVTEASTTYDNSFFGESGFRDVAQVEDADGNHLVWIAHNTGVILFNATSNNFITYSNGGYNTGLGPNRIVTDSRDGRIGAYIRNDYHDTTANSNIVYIDTNGTFLNSGDDNVEWFSTPAAFNYRDMYSVTLDETNNALYMGKPGVGLVKVGDNGTPTDSSDYTAPTTYSVPATVTDVVVDNTNDAIFFITNDRDQGGIYVVTDISDDPWDFSGQTVTRLAVAADVEYQSLMYMHFLEGPQYVGNQLFIGTDQGKVFYYNTNNTYTSTADDTLISLDLSQNRYPLAIGEIVIKDYDTLLVSYDRLGLYEVDLVRGWDTTNAAVVLAPLPTHRLNINNITLQALNIITRIDSDGNVAPNSQASASPYYSLDDGNTWTALTVGDTQNFNTDNYRLRFKIDLAQNPGTSPIVDEFNVAFGAYQADPTTDHFGVTVQSGSKWTGQNFNFTIQAEDALNYLTPDYNGTVNVKLYNATTDQEVSWSPTTATLASGTVTVSSQIGTAGDYYITANGDGYSGQSADFTINQTAVSGPVPTMRFTADRYIVTKGESLTMSWTTTDFDTLTLSGVGSVNGSDSLTVTPPFSSTYTLTGTSSYGTVSSSIYVIVHADSGGVEGVTTGSDETTSDSTTASSTGTTTTKKQLSQDTSGNDTGESTETNPDITESENSTDETSALPTIIFTSSNGDQTVRRGEKIRVEWNVTGNPDTVFIDYMNAEVSRKGHFELIAEKDLTITLTATKDGEVLSETIEIDVEGDGILQGTTRAIFVGLIFLILLFLIIFFWKRRRRKEEEKKKMKLKMKTS